MNLKKIVIPTIIIAIIVSGLIIYCHYKKNNYATTIINSNSLTVHNPLFSTDQSNLYYKLEQVIGDIGMPSNSITVNLENSVTINGETYYKVYNYATRAAYTTPVIYEGKENNFSQLVSRPIYVSEDGQIIKDVSNKIEKNYYDNLNKLSNEEKYNSLYQIVAEYVEGYTANNPNYKLDKNDNYQGELNNSPNMKIDVSSYKTINNVKCYKATINLDSKNITIYVALDGYIYIQSKADYEKLFFPAYLAENISVENSNV